MGTEKSIPNVKNEISRYTNIAKSYSSKKKAISVRLTQSDIYLLKQKALSTGISYQNIIQSLVHQYTHNKIKELHYRFILVLYTFFTHNVRIGIVSICYMTITFIKVLFASIICKQEPTQKNYYQYIFSCFNYRKT